MTVPPACERPCAPASGRDASSSTVGAHHGGGTLHQFRHFRTPHDVEDGVSTPMLMTKSGYTSVASLARYARPFADALARMQARRDPAPAALNARRSAGSRWRTTSCTVA